MRPIRGGIGAWECGDYIVCTKCERKAKKRGPGHPGETGVEEAIRTNHRIAMSQEEIDDTYGVVGLFCDACGGTIVKKPEREDEVGL